MRRPSRVMKKLFSSSGGPGWRIVCPFWRTTERVRSPDLPPDERPRARLASHRSFHAKLLQWPPLELPRPRHSQGPGEIGLGQLDLRRLAVLSLPDTLQIARLRPATFEQ